jgi:D-hydroxyproline dehydrogenase subunit alpha
MPYIGSRPTAVSALRDGDLYGVPCDRRRDPSNPHLPSIGSRRNGDRRTMTVCDLLVVGAGPAGMAAATTAAEAGLRVILVDNADAPGGQIWRREIDGAQSSRKPHSAEYRARMERLGKAAVELRCGHQVVARPGSDCLRLESAEGHEDVGYERLILATGARERFLPFPGWTLSGVMGVGGLQAMIKSGLPMKRKRVVVAGTGPLLLAVTAALVRRGAEVAGIFEQAPFARLARFGLALGSHPGKVFEALGYRLAALPIPYHTGAWVLLAEGSDRLCTVTAQVAGKRRTLDCDYLASGFHLIPNLELPRLIGCRIAGGFVAVDESQLTSEPRVYCAGEPTGIGGLEKALVEGEIAGLAAAGRRFSHLSKRRSIEARFVQRLQDAFALRAELRSVPEPSTIVCRCEDVPLGELAGMRGWREAKLQTHSGMGPCQGRICSPAALELFGWGEDSVRPPHLPARVGTLAASPGSVPALEPGFESPI